MTTNEQAEPIRLDDISPLTQLMAHTLINQKTGMGTKRSPFQNVEIVRPHQLTYQEENWIYQGNGFVQNIINLLPIECASDWVQIKQGKGRKAFDENLISYLDELAERTYTGIGIRECFKRASRQARKHGDCFVALFIADGREPWEPVNYDSIQSFKGFFVLRREQVEPLQYWVGDPLDPIYYRIFYYHEPLEGGGGYSNNKKYYKQKQEELEREIPKEIRGTTIWHRNRILRFTGTPADEDSILDNGGFNSSCLQAIINAFAYWQQGIMAGADMLHNYNQGVWRSEELLDLVNKDVKTGTDKNIKAIEQRLLTAQMGMSVLKALLIDKDKEDFTFLTRNYSGAKDIMESLERCLGACLDIPPFKAFRHSMTGQGLATTNTAGLSQRFEWLPYKQVFIENYWLKNFRKVARIVSAAADTPFDNLPVNVILEPASKVILTKEEEAGVRKTMAETDKIYIDSGVYLPEEARARIVAAEYSLDLFLKEKIPKQEQLNQEQQGQPNQNNISSNLPRFTAEEIRAELQRRGELHSDANDDIFSDEDWDELSKISAADFVEAGNAIAQRVPKERIANASGFDDHFPLDEKSGIRQNEILSGTEELRTLKLKELEAIAKEVGANTPAKYRNHKASWIAEIEKVKNHV